MDLESIYVVPAFVKEASADLLSLDTPDALIIAGYRFDNPAAAWTSAATLRKQAMEDPYFTPGHAVSRSIATACQLFGIADEAFQLRSSSFNHIMAKTASEYADIVVGSEQDYRNAVDAVLQKRASGSSFDLCQQCAAKLVEVGKQEGYTLDEAKETRLNKLAGVCPVDFEAGIDQLCRREAFARQIGEHEAADTLHKFASVCLDTTDEGIVPYIIKGIDEFDLGVKTLQKTASAAIKRPEDAFYMSPAEYIQKQANKPLTIDKDTTIPRGVLLNPDKVEDIAEWAAECGYIIEDDATPEDIISVISKMPYSLRGEFKERFI